MQTVMDGEYLRVLKVAPRGNAEQAGICIGDVLLSANGVGLLGASEEQVCALHCTARHHTAPHSTALHCTALTTLRTAPHCTTLAHFLVPSSLVMELLGASRYI